MATTILLVEDEESLHHTLRLNLELEGYQVTSAYNGTQALQSAVTGYYSLIILDIMLPEVDGLTVLQTLRVQQNKVPILILSAKATSADRVAGLKLGADDYLDKPFNLDELLLRVQNIISKHQLINDKETVTEQYTFGMCNINYTTMLAVGINGQAIKLTKKEIMLLKLLIDNAGAVVTRDKILQTVWGYQVYPTTRTIDNFILNFRKYFEADSKNPQHFFSVRGFGYKFVA